MQEGERIAALLTVREFEENKFIVMGTKLGEVKKTELSAFSNPVRAASSRWTSSRAIR
jgi:DNA gyrase subunit A